MHDRRPWALVLLFVFFTGTAFSQTLTLPEAVSVALEKNPARKAALAERTAAAAGVIEARSALLPRLSFSETLTRGNDPVYAFGTRLRQGRFTMSDFELNRLNTPSPIGNFASRFSGQWTVFDSFNNYLQIRRAREMSQAASHALDRAEQETVMRVIQAYYNLLLATRQQGLAQQTVETARAILERSRNRVEAGVVVESDMLAAQVTLASREQEAIRARSAVSLAQAQLAMAMGVPAVQQFTPAEQDAGAAFHTVPLEDLERDALANRPDLKRVASETHAQRLGAQAARAAFGPRVNVFGSWELNNVNLTGNGNDNWVAGAEVQIDLFSGGAKLARVSREKATLERAEAMKQAFEDGVRLDVRRAFYDFDAARQMLDVSRAAVQQAEDGLRITQNRYDAGLATITDLLRAEDAARAARTNYWQSVYGHKLAYANLQLATGALTPQSPVVTQ